MPYLDVKLYQGRLTPETTRALIERLTEAVVDVFGEEIRDQTWIVLQEIAPSRWGIGGRPGGLTRPDSSEACGVPEVGLRR